MADEETEGTSEEERDEELSDEETEAEEAEESETDEDSDEGEDDSDEDEDDSDSDDSDEDEDEDEDDEEEDPFAQDSMASNVGKTKIRSKKKTGRKKRGGSSATAGQRLAAAKAAKAAKKIAEREERKAAEEAERALLEGDEELETDEFEDAAIQQAEQASAWLAGNRNLIVGGISALVVIAAVGFGISEYMKKKSGEVSIHLWHATDALTSPIVPEGEEVPPGVDQSFPSIGDRANAAIEALDELGTEGGEGLQSHAALIRANALYQRGDVSEARDAYNQALQASSEDIRQRALEGLAFTYEADENWAEAGARFDELEGTAGEILGDYHQARIAIAQGEEETAKEKLQAVLAALQEEDAPQMRFVQDQAELRLMAIDSTLVQRNAGPGNGMDPEQMRRLIEQMQRQQQQRGG